MPVTLPPGRVKLVTRPDASRSGVVAMIGIVDVCAANAMGHLNPGRQEEGYLELLQLGDDTGESLRY